MVNVEVAHEGIPSVSHMREAKRNIAMVRCSVRVRSGIPNAVDGRHHTMRLTRVTERILIVLLRTDF